MSKPDALSDISLEMISSIMGWSILRWSSACRNEVCEDFLGFVQIEKMDAQTIADKIISSVTSWGLNMDNLVGQGYDGAATMSSSKNGVQAKIRNHYKNATYVHCRSHVLALALAAGCKQVTEIQNLFDNVGKLTY